jgi:hypothetical protein
VLTEYHSPTDPTACRLLWPTPPGPRCEVSPDGSVWHTLGYCSPDIVTALRQAVRGSQLPNLTPLAAWLGWYAIGGELYVAPDAHWNPALRPYGLMAVWFCGSPHRVAALLVYRNQLLDPTLYTPGEVAQLRAQATLGLRTS